MKKLHINGELFELEHQQANSLGQALSHYFNGEKQSTFALALNGEFIGKAEYETTPISCGDSIDIMLPIQGG